MLQLSRIEDGKTILPRTHHARRFTQRLVGLIGKKSMPADEGMLFEPGGSIHTFGMRFSIDVLFLDKSGVILNSKTNVAPNRICIAPMKTRYVIEMPSNTLSLHELENGQKLGWQDDN